MLITAQITFIRRNFDKMSASSGKTPTRLGVNKNPNAGGTKLSFTKKTADTAISANYGDTATSMRAKVNTPWAAARRNSAKQPRSKLPLLIIVVVIIIAAGAFGWWKFMGGAPANYDGNFKLPQRQAQATGNIKYKYDAIDITYKREQSIEGQFIVIGYDSWEDSPQRFSDGHISLLPLGTAQALRQKYQNIFNADGDPAGQQTINNAVLNMPFIYNHEDQAPAKKGLEEVSVNYTSDRIILIHIKGTTLSYVKGTLNGNEMPAPKLRGGAHFQFVELNEVEIMDYNWSYGN